MMTVAIHLTIFMFVQNITIRQTVNACKTTYVAK